MPAVKSTRRQVRRGGRLASAAPARLLAAAVLIGSGGAGLAYSENPGKVIDVVGRAGGFEVRMVHIEGHEHTSGSAVVAALGLGGHVSLLTLDVEDVRERIETLPWVTSATVRKVLPSALDIALVEAEPVARWSAEGVEALVAADGRVLSVQDDVLARFGGLFVPSSPGGVHASDAAPTRSPFSRRYLTSRVGRRPRRSACTTGVGLLLRSGGATCVWPGALIRGRCPLRSDARLASSGGWRPRRPGRPSVDVAGARAQHRGAFARDEGSEAVRAEVRDRSESSTDHDAISRARSFDGGCGLVELPAGRPGALAKWPGRAFHPLSRCSTRTSTGCLHRGAAEACGRGRATLRPIKASR